MDIWSSYDQEKVRTQPADWHIHMRDEMGNWDDLLVTLCPCVTCGRLVCFRWNMVSTWHVFPSETYFLSSKYLASLFIFDIFFKNDIPFFSGFGSGWLPEMHSRSALLPDTELGTGKASSLLSSTNGVLGFRHLPWHNAVLPQEGSPGGHAAFPGGAHLEEACPREHTWHLQAWDDIHSHPGRLPPALLWPICYSIPRQGPWLGFCSLWYQNPRLDHKHVTFHAYNLEEEEKK